MALILTIPLRNYSNHFYVGSLRIGNPSTLHDVSFNTGVHEIWIPGSSGQDFETTTYDHDESETYDPYPETEANLELQIHNISLSAIRRSEVFSFPGVNGGIRSPFCEVYYSYPIDYYNVTKWAGIVGLSFSPQAPPYTPPIWRTMMDDEILHRNIFSIWMGDYRLSGFNEGGEIIFGGTNDDHYYDEHEYFEIVEDRNSWMISMASVVVGENHQMQSGKALIHTGSEYIYGPPRIIQLINTQILHAINGRIRRQPRPPPRQAPLMRRTVLKKHEMEPARELVQEQRMPNVSFNFFGGDRDYILTPSQYFIPDERKPRRFSTIFRPMYFQQESAEYFTLGVPFLRRYHSIFDFGNRRIGLAPSFP